MFIKRTLSSTAVVAALLLSACGTETPTAVPVPTAVPTATTAPATQAPTMAPTLPPTTVPTTAPTLAPTTAAATPTIAPAAGLEKVTLTLDWTPNTNHTGFYVAQQKGWYKEQGIDLQILPYTEAAGPDALVSAGKADFGISFEEQVVADRMTGLPVKSVAAIIQHNTSALVTLKSSGIDRPAKLEDTRYAGFGTPYEVPVIEEVVKCDKGDPSKIKEITADLFGYQALVAKQADFVWIYKGWEAIQAKRDGVELNEFLIKDYCVPDYYTPVIITSEAFLKDKADLGKRFIAATTRGFRFAIDQPDQAADLLIAANPPETFPDKGLVHDSAQYLAKEYQAEAPRWGEQTLKGWTDYPKFMIATGKLEDANHKVVTGDLDYAAFFTNDLLPAK